MPRHTKLEILKRQLRMKGWTQPEAAERLGVRYEHVNRVLNGRRVSARLLREIDALPARGVAAAR